MEKISVNQRDYCLPDRPVVVICADGCAGEYLALGFAHGELPRLAKELKTGAVNVNQVPGFRMECSPFGGVKDSGLGIKEGVIEAMKFMTTTKTFSLPW